MNPPDPSQVNITKVKVNLTNLQTFNNLLYTYSIPLTLNAFLLLSRDPSSDPGLSVGVNLLCGSLWGIGGEFGFLGSVAANYYTAMISQFFTKPPESLVGQLVSYTCRIQNTSIEANKQMAEDYTNPLTNWSTVKSGTLQTPWGPKEYSSCLAQLATVDFPDQTNPLFEELIQKATFAFDQTLWWILLNSIFQINGWNRGPYGVPATYLVSDVSNGDTEMNEKCRAFILKDPSSWSYWTNTHVIKRKKDKSYYTILNYSIGYTPKKTARTLIDQHMNNDAAKYLFIDSIPGNIINPKGLFTRVFVFTQFGLKTVEQIL